MNRQAACDWQTLYRTWQDSRPEERFPEAEAVLCLTQIEKERESGTADPLELNRAEAVLLTRLAEARAHHSREQLLAWVERARKRDPEYRPAAKLAVRLHLDVLASVDWTQGWPAVRETDHAAARRRQVLELLARAEACREQTKQWRTLIGQGMEAARAAGDPADMETFPSLSALLDRVILLLEEVCQRAADYAESLNGLYHSAERLTALKESLRALTACGEEWRDATGMLLDPPEDKRGQAGAALEELEQLIGLDEIKERIRKWAAFLRYQQRREELGWSMRDRPDLHLVLMGNPGTGKTTIARLMARLYHELGLLERPDVIEVDRSHLVGAYLGQTEQRTMETVQRALGGVLFIDEAYSLKRADSSGSDYGQVAIDTLVAAMTSGDHAGRFVVILAGYPEEMRTFLMANPGLRSRFPETGHFLLPDYTTEELLAIGEAVARRNDYLLAPQARALLAQRIERERVDESFGNARTVRHIVMDAIFTKGARLRRDELKLDDCTLLLPEDLSPDPPDMSEGDAPYKGSVQERLDKLVGLNSFKAEMEKIAAFVRVQRVRQAQGLPAVPVELHAVFTGHPGTGKTTAARLYAEWLREIGYLKRGHLVVAGRADLVAGYTGQTATATRRKVRQALGGVLLIDEAYALAAGGEHDFGREALQTLVDEMTRHQENLVVVLAGYPAEMEQLMAVNPGLASRFKKYLHFPDYTPDELGRILVQEIERHGCRIREEVLGRIVDRLQHMAQAGPLAGNARFVHNLAREALQNQALRIAGNPAGEWQAEQLMELVWDDFAPLLA